MHVHYSKPKNQRVKRELERREPKLVENVKAAMFIRGGNTSETVTRTLKELVIYCYTTALYSVNDWGLG